MDEILKVRERIKDLIEKEGMAVSDFAEYVDLKKTTLSHTLNGRNKPSLQIVLQILNKFTNVNPGWLLKGEGAMYINSNGQQSLFETETQPENLEQDNPITEELPTPQPQAEMQEKPKEVNTNITPEPISQTANSQPQQNPVILEAEKIIVLNKDNTFTEYVRRR